MLTEGVHLYRLSKILTIAVMVLAIITVLVVSYNLLEASKNSYNSQIESSFSRSPLVYDYSCGENDYQIHFTITNTGVKNVEHLSVTVTNPICVGGNPVVPASLNASSTLNFYVQTTNQNGTLTISGNNTLVQVKF